MSSIVSSRSTLIAFTLHTVNDNLLHGFLLIVGVVWLFLRTISGSLVVAIVVNDGFRYAGREVGP